MFSSFFPVFRASSDTNWIIFFSIIVKKHSHSNSTFQSFIFFLYFVWECRELFLIYTIRHLFTLNYIVSCHCQLNQISHFQKKKKQKFQYKLRFQWKLIQILNLHSQKFSHRFPLKNSFTKDSLHMLHSIHVNKGKNICFYWVWYQCSFEWIQFYLFVTFSPNLFFMSMNSFIFISHSIFTDHLLWINLSNIAD